MIVGIGTDIIRIDRIAKVLDRAGVAFARRVLTPAELVTFAQRSSPAPWLAKRFAAKEAVAKAFGTGIGRLSFQHIEVFNDPSGAPQLRLHDYGLELQQERGVRHLHVSLSDEQDNALAFVVLER